MAHRTVYPYYRIFIINFGLNQMQISPGVYREVVKCFASISAHVNEHKIQTSTHFEKQNKIIIDLHKR